MIAILNKDNIIKEIIKKEDVIYIKKIINKKYLRSTFEDSIGFMNILNEKIYLYKDFNKNFHYYDLSFCSEKKKEEFYNSIVLNSSKMKINTENGLEYLYNNLEHNKIITKEKNQKIFEDLIKNKYVIFKNNKYSINLSQHQKLINLINNYYIEKKINNKLKLYWSTIDGMTLEWSINNLLELNHQITKEIKKYENKKIEYNNLIYKCQSAEELNAIDFTYE